MNHEEVAERSDTSSSSVYRAVERFDDILGIENGVLQFVDDVVRQEISDIVERFAAAKDSADRAIRRTAKQVSPLDSHGDGPSALEQWLNRHGIIAQETYDGLELRFDEAVSHRKLR